METTTFYIIHPGAFYRAFLDIVFEDIQVLKIKAGDNGCIYVTVVCMPRVLFWLGLQYEVQCSIK